MLVEFYSPSFQVRGAALTVLAKYDFRAGL